jgi:sigma-B regulation protein RsbU (phosphoserine phosphatase)
MKILIADDDAITRRLLETILSKWGYEVQIAQDGDEAWAALQGEGAPKLAILDWMMPGLDGVEICRRARQRMDSPYVYMMLLTSKIRKEDIIEGMDAGADDYLTKPFNRHELEVRLRAGLRILDLQEALMASGDELALGRERETQTAHRIRQTLLLAEPPTMQIGLEIAAATVPGSEQEGDFYDFFPHGARADKGETLDIVVGEVLGRGLPAALIAAATKNHFLRVLHRASQGEGGVPSPSEVVTQVHDAVGGQFLGQKSFETLCYARFDAGAKRLEYVDCGHTPTAYYSAASKTCRMLRGDNMPLGFGQHETYRQLGLPFAPGDLFVFYSEGVTTAKSADGAEYGPTRLADFVVANASAAPTELIARLHADVEAFAPAPRPAPLTCVAVKVTE